MKIGQDGIWRANDFFENYLHLVWWKRLYIRVIVPVDLCGQGNCEVRCPRASKICGEPVARRVFHAEPLPFSKAINSISPSLSFSNWSGTGRKRKRENGYTLKVLSLEEIKKLPAEFERGYSILDTGEVSIFMPISRISSPLYTVLYINLYIYFVIDKILNWLKLLTINSLGRRIRLETTKISSKQSAKETIRNLVAR